MKKSTLLMLTISLVATFSISACAPFFHGGPRGGGDRRAEVKFSEKQSFASVNDYQGANSQLLRSLKE